MLKVEGNNPTLLRIPETGEHVATIIREYELIIMVKQSAAFVSKFNTLEEAINHANELYEQGIIKSNRFSR